MYDPQTYADSPSVTSSPALAFGPTLSDEQVGEMIARCGLDHALASLSARQVAAMGLLTSGICGRTGSTSSNSAALQTSLESRLRARTQNLGSTLFKMTWKPWVTPSGRSRFRLRASALRTSGTDCTGWPTATTRDWKDGAECPNVPLNALLGRVAWLADSGPTLSGSPVETTSGGQLNPEFSRWLMALPPEWDDCAPTATRSSRIKPSRSSKPLPKLW